MEIEMLEMLVLGEYYYARAHPIEEITWMGSMGSAGIDFEVL